MALKEEKGTSFAGANFSTFFKNTFSIFFSSIGTILALAAIIFLPYVLISLGLFTMILDNPRQAFGPIIAIFLLSIGFSMVLSGAITYGIFHKLKGRDPSVGECLQVAIKKLMPLIGLSFLYVLILAGGFVLLIIPGFIFMCMFYVCVPVLIVENSGITEALRRSKELTYGYKRSIFGLIFVLGIFNNITSGIVEQAFKGAGAVGGIPMTVIVNNLVLNVVWQAIGAVAIVVVYYLLRKEKENTDLDDLVKVFD